MNKIINTDKAPKAIGPYSQAVLAGNTLYIALYPVNVLILSISVIVLFPNTSLMSAIIMSDIV